MKFPSYELPPSRKNVLGCYIDFVARTELDRRQAEDVEPIQERPARIDEITRLIGEGCVRLYTNSTQRPGPNVLFQRAFDAAKRLKQDRQPGNPTGAYATLLEQTCSIIVARNSASALDTARGLMHLNVVKLLDQSLGYRNAQEDRYVNDSRDLKAHGSAQLEASLATELVTLGLVTRLKHPRVLALPALEHHNRGRLIRNNYNIALTDITDTGNPGSTSKIQITKSCFNACDNPTEYPVPLDDTRAAYNRDIAIVSGHCDFGLQWHKTRKSEVPLAQALIAEVGEIATPEQRTMLDNRSQWLYETTVHDDSRRGTWGAYRPGEQA